METEKYAVVTGATKGIGRAITERLLREGYCVIGNYAHDEEAAAALLAANSAYQGRLSLIKCDLSTYEAAIAQAHKIKAQTSSIEVLVCNSGTTDITSFPEITWEGWSRVMNTNLNAPFFLIQALSASLTDERGRVILIGSSMGQYPHARSVSYGVSKAAIQALARYLVKYLSPRGITVNCIVPSFIDTPWQAVKAPDHRKRIEDKIALHRFGTAQEVAELCMAVIRNQFINGSVLTMDGGYCYQ